MNYAETHLRQTDVIPADILNTPITIVGAGGIGSHTAYLLARTGFKNLTVFDDDTVEKHNLGGQIYTKYDVGRHKVDALKGIILRDTDIKINEISSRYFNTEEYPVVFEGTQFNQPKIVISGVDSMASRHAILDLLPFTCEYYIDGRMSISECQVYTCEPHVNRAKYLTTLFSDTESTFQACSAQQTMFTAYFMAGAIVNQVVHILTKASYKSEINLDSMGLRLGAR